ncbi:GTP-binding protein [Roseomonas rosulenta]
MTLHRAPESRELLRFLTCGSVDDGKSTLIGRLLFDSQLIFEDTLAAITRDSRKHGTTGEDVDLALLVDGLEAERQQGITIDVAYRFFATPRRSFIVADTPGHEQYTRNMATGASGAPGSGIGPSDATRTTTGMTPGAPRARSRPPPAACTASTRCGCAVGPSRAASSRISSTRASP